MGVDGREMGPSPVGDADGIGVLGRTASLDDALSVTADNDCAVTATGANNGTGGVDACAADTADTTGAATDDDAVDAVDVVDDVDGIGVSTADNDTASAVTNIILSALIPNEESVALPLLVGISNPSILKSTLCR